MYQAGVKNITLYENKGISFSYYDSQNENAITDLTGQGSILQVENDQLIEFDINMFLGNSGDILNDYMIKFFVLGYTLDNIELVKLLQNSIYGWCVDVEFYDGTHKFYNTPLKVQESKAVMQEEMSFSIEMKTPVPSTKIHLDYDPTASVITTYRADTTLLTADNAIYTADYAADYAL